MSESQPGPAAKPLKDWIAQYLTENLGASKAPMGYYVPDILAEVAARLRHAPPDSPSLTWRSTSSEMWRQLGDSLTGELTAMDPTWVVPVVVVEHPRFHVTSLIASSEEAIVISVPTVTLLVRAFKYWAVLLNPSQLCYLSSAGLFGSRRSLWSSISDACHELFASFEVHGFSTSPTVRLNVSGTALMEFVLEKSLLFLCLHEAHHILRKGGQSDDSEFQADCFALECLIRTDSTKYFGLLSNFWSGGERFEENHNEFPELFTRLEISPISIAAPWHAAIFAYVRILESLTRTGGGAIPREDRLHIRDVAYAVYGDDAEKLRQDLESVALPAMYWGRAWTLSDGASRLSWGQFLKQSFSQVFDLLRFAAEVRRRARSRSKTQRLRSPTSK